MLSYCYYQIRFFHYFYFMPAIFKETPDTKKLWSLTLQYFKANRNKYSHLIDKSVFEDIEHGVWDTPKEYLAALFLIQNDADSPQNVKKYIDRVTQLIKGNLKIGDVA